MSVQRKNIVFYNAASAGKMMFLRGKSEKTCYIGSGSIMRRHPVRTLPGSAFCERKDLVNSIQLEYFAAVARAGGFSAAARKLCLTQPALSKQIRLLEEELGVPLFLRQAHGIHLTKEGTRLLSRAEEITRKIRNIPSELHDMHRPVSGELNIVSGFFISRKIMPDLLKRLLLRYPGIRPRIREVSQAEQTEAILNGTADIGIGSFHRPHERLSCHPIFKSDLVLIRSSRSDLADRKRLTKRQIAARDLICHPQGTLMHSLVRRILHPYAPNVFMDSANSSTIIELVRENFGLAFVPDYLIEPEQRSGIIIGGFETGEQLTVSYHYDPGRTPSPQTQAYIGIIREKFGLDPSAGGQDRA